MKAPDKRWQSWRPQHELQRLLQASLVNLPLQPPPCWEELLPLLSRHQLDPFIFNRMAQRARGRELPEEVWQEWVKLQQRRTVTALRGEEQLRQLLQALQQAGVAVMPLKGAWLAEHLYDDIVERQMGDIDLLIRPAEFERVQQAVVAAGYQLQDNTTPGSWSKGTACRHPGWQRSVELQWSLSHASHGLPPQNMERLWQVAEPGSVAGVAVSTLPPVVHLVYLTYHILAHQWRIPLRALLDLVLLGERYAAGLTPTLLEREAHEWGLDFRAAFVWQVAHDFCGVPPPAELAAWGAPLNNFMSEREAVLALLLPHERSNAGMTRLLGEFHQASWWRRLAIVGQAWLIPELQVREQYATAVKWGGMAGGYLARLYDLVGRRFDDLFPARQRRNAVKAAAAEMAERLRLERWLDEQERSSLHERDGTRQDLQ